MGLADVMRDCNVKAVEAFQSAVLDDAALLEQEKAALQQLGDDELKALHTRLGTITLKGKAVCQVLKERCPGFILR